MVRAAISGDIDRAEMETDPIFGLQIPRFCPDVPASVLIPRHTWSDGEAYDRQARELAERFKQNFTQFELVTDDVRSAGPR